MLTWLRLAAVSGAPDPGLGIPVFADPGLLERPCSNILQVWPIQWASANLSGDGGRFSKGKEIDHVVFILHINISSE
jgi:hypothetical protein